MKYNLLVLGALLLAVPNSSAYKLKNQLHHKQEGNDDDSNI